MNFKNLLVVVSIVSIAIVSCKSTPENPEVENYVNKTMPAFMKEELAIMREFNEFTEIRLLNDPKTDTALRNITIPKYTKFIEKLDTITIKDTDLLAVHKQYINSSKSQLDYIKYFLNTLKLDPLVRVDSLGQKISSQKFIMMDWNSSLQQLCKKYDIKYLGN
jgi:hypothetical protein